MKILDEYPTPITDRATHDDWSGGAIAVEVEICKSLERRLALAEETIKTSLSYVSALENTQAHQDFLSLTLARILM